MRLIISPCAITYQTSSRAALSNFGPNRIWLLRMDSNHACANRFLANVRDRHCNLALRIADEIRDHVGVEK
jgi:hypothetical protein